MEILNSKNIYVINLDHRKDRIESVKKQLSSKNIK